jgi:hypothetical protein
MEFTLQLVNIHRDENLSESFLLNVNPKARYVDPRGHDISPIGGRGSHCSIW